MANVTTTDWGTKKGIAPVLVYNTAPGGAGTVTLSVAAYVPKGTRAATIHIRDWVAAAAGRTGTARATGGSIDYVRAITQVANTGINALGDVPLDASYQFDLVFNAAATALKVYVLAVYL